MDSCLFCQIIKGHIPSSILFENEEFIAFHDLHPQAPLHILVLPKQHIASLAHLKTQDLPLIGRLTLLLPEIAHSLGLKEGFKTIVNTGSAGGQEIFHLHYHLLGWPEKNLPS